MRHVLEPHPVPDKARRGWLQCRCGAEVYDGGIRDFPPTCPRAQERSSPKQYLWTPGVGNIMEFLMEKMAQGYRIVSVCAHEKFNNQGRDIYGYLVIGEETEDSRRFEETR